MPDQTDYSSQISSPDKVLFPAEGYTKAQLVSYYMHVSRFLLPHLRDRPLMLQRFPGGIAGKGFFQKEIMAGAPEWLQHTTVARENQDPIEQVVANNKKSLLYLVNQNTISLHTWLSRRSNLNIPDKMVFDFDPPEGRFDMAVKGALALRELLEGNYGFKAFVMTTGSSGLHVTVPLRAAAPFEQVREFARGIAVELAQAHPDEFTTEVRIEARQGRLFLDYLRNSYAQTAIAPFSVRAKPGAPVAMPLHWEELQDEGLHAQKYTIMNTLQRLQQLGDPWKGWRRHARSISRSRNA